MAFVVYDTLKEYMGDGTIDLDDTTEGRFRAALVTSSYPASNANTVFANISSFLATNTSANVVNVDSVEWNRVGPTVTWQSNQVVFTASGGTMTGRYVVVFDSIDAADDATDPLIGYFDLGGDEAVNDGGTLTIRKTGTSNIEYFDLT